MGALLRNMWVDFRNGLWRIVPNRIAGSHLVPGPLRMLLLRAAGLDIRSASMRGGSRFTLPRVTIERGVFVNEGCFFEAKGRITIRAGTLLGPNVTILTSNHALTDGIPDMASTASPVTVGRNCWLGANCILTPGVTLADRVTVAAGAIVTKDLDGPGVYAGVPARKVS